MRLGVRFSAPKCKLVLVVVTVAFIGYALLFNTEHSDYLKDIQMQRMKIWMPGRHATRDKKESKPNEMKDENNPANSLNPTSMHQPNNSYSQQNTSRPELNLLVSELKRRLEILEPEKEIVNMTSACHDLHIDYKDKCPDDVCPQKVLPESPEERIKQLAFRPNLQVPQNYTDVIKGMAAAISGYYDVILVSAFSHNHFMEAQAMLKNIHEKVLPVLKNFRFVVYDLGLEDKERNEVRTYCRCTLLQFPFEKFPEYFRTLKCFSWKVTVIRAMYEKANLVIWTDSSIRFTRPQILLQYIERARKLGLQQRFKAYNTPNPYYTLPQMFKYFGDSPCAHMAFPQVETGFGIYHKEPLVQHAVLDPWYACAVRADCICPVEQKTVQICPNFRGSTKIGLCMRNEQSAISIILAKLFREKYRAIVVKVGSFQRAMREQTYPYFDELRKQHGHGSV